MRHHTFAALALYKQPTWRERLRADPAARRPFFPFTVAWVLLDRYGTNRDPRRWGRPEVFDPRRFLTGEAAEAAFVPQASAS